MSNENERDLTLFKGTNKIRKLPSVIIDIKQDMGIRLS